jgi:formamidopyrimidine-DNA glycosylase
MPELPEVETIVRALRAGNGAPPLPGQRVTQVSVGWPRHIVEPSLPAFRKRIRGREIREIHRRGKYLVFTLDEGTLLIHLRMSGDLLMASSETPRGPYDHTVFHLQNGWELRFSDARKFGRVHLVRDPNTVLGNLGPEPLAEGFTPLHLEEILKGRQRQVKSLLLDQTFIAGLGNIYTDEALHRAKLHPLRRSNSLNREEIRSLWLGIRESLKMGIHHNGASIDWVYRGGSFQNHFLVYKRAGEPCVFCLTPIQRIVVAQRGTHFCPSCQQESTV